MPEGLLQMKDLCKMANLDRSSMQVRLNHWIENGNTVQKIKGIYVFTPEEAERFLNETGRIRKDGTKYTEIKRVAEVPEGYTEVNAVRGNIPKSTIDKRIRCRHLDCVKFKNTVYINKNQIEILLKPKERGRPKTDNPKVRVRKPKERKPKEKNLIAEARKEVIREQKKKREPRSFWKIAVWDDDWLCYIVKAVCLTQAEAAEIQDSLIICGINAHASPHIKPEWVGNKGKNYEYF